MAIATAEGFARGFVDRDYPMSGTGIPALSSFYFGYGVGGAPTDNHLQYLMALPGGFSRDLTPNADLNPNMTPQGRLSLAFRDEDHGSARDRYFYRVSHSMLSQDFSRRFQVRDVGDSGAVNRPFPLGAFGPRPHLDNSVIGIAGFKIFFTGNRDHHIDQIKVMVEDNGTYTVGFNDKNDDDIFAYNIDFVAISGLLSNVRTGEISGSARGFDRREVRLNSNANFVLRGFDFNFRESDHHLREIGVLRTGSRIDVVFGDKNGDDLFDYSVRWAEVSPRVFEPISG
jgi:hypothetical protein